MSPKVEKLPRRVARAAYPDAIHFGEIDDDLDDFEEKLLAEVQSIKNRLNGVLGLGFTILITLIGALAALALK